MRLLTSLVLLQCAGIGFLVYKSIDSGAVTPAVEPSAPVPATTVIGQVPSAPDEERLRRIIREELAQLTLAAPGGATATVAGPRNPEADRERRELVDRQIDEYRSVGRISDVQMQDLQRDIAQLDPASRKEMLAKLMRAMNAREIQGLM